MNFAIFSEVEHNIIFYLIQNQNLKSWNNGWLNTMDMHISKTFRSRMLFLCVINHGDILNTYNLSFLIVSENFWIWQICRQGSSQSLLVVMISVSQINVTKFCL